jgi:hypothetical protein
MKFIHLFIICQLEHGKKAWIKTNLVKIRPYLLKDLEMTEHTHDIVLERLEAGDSICLLDMKNLSYADLDKLFEEIKYWKVYGNIDTKVHAVKRW